MVTEKTFCVPIKEIEEELPPETRPSVDTMIFCIPIIEGIPVPPIPPVPPEDEEEKEFPWALAAVGVGVVVVGIAAVAKKKKP